MISKKSLSFISCTALTIGGILTGVLSGTTYAFAANDADAVIPTSPPSHMRATMLSFTVSQEARAVPDTLVIHLSARIENPSPTIAQQHLNQSISTAMALLKGQKDVTVTTGSYTVGETYAPHNQRSWVARQGITLSGEKKDTLLTLAEKLQKVGLNIDDMQWTLTPHMRDTLEQQARLGALKKVREQAEEDAAALGATLAGLDRVRIGAEIGDGPFEPHGVMLMARSAAAPAPESAAGEQVVTVTVTAQARLVDKDAPLGPPGAGGGEPPLGGAP